MTNKELQLIKSQSENESDYIGKLLELLVQKDTTSELAKELREIGKSGSEGNADRRSIWNKSAFQSKVQEELLRQIRKAVEEKDLSPIVEATEALTRQSQTNYTEGAEALRILTKAVEEVQKSVRESKAEPLDLKPLYKVLKDENTKTGRTLNKILKKEYPKVEIPDEVTVKEPSWITKLIPQPITEKTLAFLKKWSFRVQVENPYTDENILKALKSLDKSKDHKDFRKFLEEWFPRLVPSFPADGAKESTAKTLATEATQLAVKSAIENISVSGGGGIPANKATDAYSYQAKSEAGGYKYFFFEDGDGNWYILRLDSNSVASYAKGTGGYASVYVNPTSAPSGSPTWGTYDQIFDNTGAGSLAFGANGELKVGIYDERGIQINELNPISVNEFDSSGRTSFNTVFGEKLIGQRFPSFADQFQYGLYSENYNLTELNGGTITIVDSMLNVSSGLASNGRAVLETKRYLQYVAGHEAYAIFTAVFTTPKANSSQRVGLYDDNNGFFIGYEGTTFGVTRRRTGTDTFTPVNLTFTEHDHTLDPTKGNVYKISFGYLGFAAIFFEVMLSDGRWHEFASIDYPNTQTVTHITQTSLPFRITATNSGNTSNINVASGSFTFGVVNGDGRMASDRTFNYSLFDYSTGNGDNTVVVFRNVTSFKSLVNRIPTQLILISTSTDGTKNCGWRLVRNPTITNTPTWTSVNADSVMEYSTDAIINYSTGDTRIGWAMGKADSFFQIVKDLDILARPGDVWAFVMKSQLSNSVGLSIRWNEKF